MESMYDIPWEGISLDCILSQLPWSMTVWFPLMSEILKDTFFLTLIGNHRRMGGGGGGLVKKKIHCAKKKFLYDQISTTEDYICSKRFESKTKFDPKISFCTWIFVPLARISSGFARILLVFCPNMATWKIHGGGGGCSPPPPAHMPMLAMS